MMFPTEIILTIATGRHLGVPLIEVQKALAYMTGDDVYTHQIPRCLKECGPIILERYPHLLEGTEGLEGEDWILWAEKKVGEFGAMLDIQPIIDNMIHEVLDPVEEPAQQIGPDKVIIMEGDIVETVEGRRKRLFTKNLLAGS